MSLKNKTIKQPVHLQLFWAIIAITLILWFLYRSLFNFPVVFDETLGKALFLGLPIWMYVSIIGQDALSETPNFRLTKSGLIKGILYGGLFSFIAVFLSLATKGETIIPVDLFNSFRFWKEFLLAIMTAFWESIFFFGFIQVVLQKKYKNLDATKRVMLTGLIFLLFHLPNSILRFQGIQVAQQIWLMSLFGLGQALLFETEKSIYTLIFTHTFWGMTLLIHF